MLNTLELEVLNDLIARNDTSTPAEFRAFIKHEDSMTIEVRLIFVSQETEHRFANVALKPIEV